MLKSINVSYNCKISNLGQTSKLTILSCEQEQEQQELCPHQNNPSRCFPMAMEIYL